MFPALEIEVDVRFNEIQNLITATKKLKGNQAAAIKGLIFVQIYAVYEFIVNSAVSAAIDSIQSHNHQLRDITPSLLTLFLDPEFSSISDGQRKNAWENRLKLFNRAFSNNVLDLSSETRPPSDGSHYRYTQLLLIFEVFGISRAPVRRRAHERRIDEVVRHRNSIAHGGEKAEDIGRRYTHAEVRKRISQMRSVCNSLISILSSFSADVTKHTR